LNILLSANVPDGQANQIARNLEHGQSWLDGNIEFNCAVTAFARRVPSLGEVQLTVVNENFRHRAA